MQYKFTVDGKEFTVNMDTAKLIDAFENGRFGEFDEGYVEYGNSAEFGDACLTEKQYKKYKSDYIQDIKSINEATLEAIVQTWPKKKNGWLNLRSVNYICSSNICVYICEWHNTWIYDTVKAVATGDSSIDIVAYERVDTPG